MVSYFVKLFCESSDLMSIKTKSYISHLKHCLAMLVLYEDKQLSAWPRW